jgi:hypothetical protein
LFGQLSTDLQSLFTNITHLAWLINEAIAGNRPKLDDYIFHDTIILLGYRIVHHCPLGKPRAISRLENAVHLGLIAFMMTLALGLDGRTLQVPLLPGLLRSAAEESFGTEQKERELLLWILFIGGRLIFGSPDEAWLLPKTAEATCFLVLHSWEGVSSTLVKFPWFNTAHDKSGQDQWCKSSIL